MTLSQTEILCLEIFALKRLKLFIRNWWKGSFLPWLDLKPCCCGRFFFSLWRKWPFLGRRKGDWWEGREGGREHSSLVKWLLANRKPCEGCLCACYFYSWVLARQCFPFEKYLEVLTVIIKDPFLSLFATTSNVWESLHSAESFREIQWDDMVFPPFLL